MTVNKAKQPFRLSAAPAVKRPANLEDAAFWPVRHLAELVRTRQVTSLELTEMYLARLHRYNGLLNNVVTFLDDHGRAEAKRADQEIAAGKYQGPLHGIPWGAKDIISLKGYQTTWGSAPFKEQVLDYDASVIEQLRDAGAVLIAKVTTGELAGGDNWFGGQTEEPVGSDAGIERIIRRSVVGDRGRLRRVRHRHRDERIDSQPVGALRPGGAAADVRPRQPLRRDGAVVDAGSPRPDLPLRGRHRDRDAGDRKPDGRDMSVTDVPFNWNATFNIKTLKVGIIQESFDEITNASAKANAEKMLATFKSLGVTQFIPITVPNFTTGTGSFGVERTAYFEEHARAGRMKGTRGGTQSAGYLLPAPIYLQQQRARMMMMMELQKATAHVDVYIVGSNNTGVGGAAASRRRRAGGAAPPQPERPAVADAASFRLCEPRRLSGDQPAERLRRDRRPDQRGDLRAARTASSRSSRSPRPIRMPPAST